MLKRKEIAKWYNTCLLYVYMYLDLKWNFLMRFNVIMKENHVKTTFVRDGWFLQVKKKFESLIE